MMMNMVYLLSVFYILLHCSTANGQESVELIASYEHGVSEVAVQVETQHLKNVSNSVLMAETWLRNHVLAHYPRTNITTIIVGHTLLCNKLQEQHKLGLILPSIKNIHHSLTRWGLEREIKVTAAFSSDCLDSKKETFRNDVAQTYIKPLLTTLQEIGSPYIVNPPLHLHTLSDDETLTLVKSHFKSMENLGVFHLNNVKVIAPRNEKPSNRKLSFVDLSKKMMVPFPPRPNLIPPSQSPSASSHPAFAAGSPLPPLVGIVPPPQPPAANPTRSPPFLPHLSPMANPPFGSHLPPCDPSNGGGFAGAPAAGGVHNGGLWCVAKPSVPPETLQEALDYACGEGEADCEAIRDGGSCYFPDTVVAHASYAFNSYWQKTKTNGGTCGFGGTAMLINSDPSYRHCRFVLA